MSTHLDDANTSDDVLCAWAQRAQAHINAEAALLDYLRTAQ